MFTFLESPWLPWCQGCPWPQVAPSTHTHTLSLSLSTSLWFPRCVWVWLSFLKRCSSLCALRGLYFVSNKCLVAMPLHFFQSKIILALLDDREHWIGSWQPICLCPEADSRQPSGVIPGATGNNSQLTSWHRWNALLSGFMDSTKGCHLSLAVFPAKSQRSLLNWRTENCIPGDCWAVQDSPKLTIALSVHSSAARNPNQWGLHEGQEASPLFLMFYNTL